MKTIELTGFNLTLKEVVTCLYELPKITLSAESLERMKKLRAVAEKSDGLSENSSNVTHSNFEKLTTTRIPHADSLIDGVGEPVAENIARLTLLLRANVLAQGYSGVHPELVQTLLDMINNGVTPVILYQDSLGASDHLSPLAHVDQALLGEGEVWYRGERAKAATVFQKVGINPATLKVKEEWLRIQRTQCSLAIGLDLLWRLQRLLKLSDITAAFEAEGAMASIKPFAEKQVSLPPHSGALKTADNLQRLLAGSKMNQTQNNGNRGEDSDVLRCVLQVHGCAKEAYHFAKNILEIELNATTDNPLLFSDSNNVVGGWNGHDAPVTMAMNCLCMAMADLSLISKQRVATLAYSLQNEIPTLITLFDLLAIDSMPALAGQEEPVRGSVWAARKAQKIAANLEKCLAMELWVGCQAIDLSSRGEKAGRGIREIHQYIRRLIPSTKEDKFLEEQLHIAYKLAANNSVIEVAERVIGSLEIE